MEAVDLARWSDWLLLELFEDVDGEARPITTLVVDDELLVRAAARGDLDLAPHQARAAFLGAFPARSLLVRWCSGRSRPLRELLAFLVLWCFAASEAAESDLNDHRKRLRQIMGWDDTISDCSALPSLWRSLVTRMAKAVAAGELRPLILPEPADYHWQIGHAIELTFPTHADAEKLRVDLSGARGLERDDPRSVLQWLAPLVSRHRFSRSFVEAFGAFGEAWSRGERALRDDRFWTGWRLVCERATPEGDACPFELECDAWAGYRLVDTQSGETFGLAARGVERRLPPSLAALVRDASPIPLLERDWACWTWTGPGMRGRGLAKAALFHLKSLSPTRLADLEPVELIGSPGWAFTRAVDLILPRGGRPQNSTGEMLDIDIHGVPRVDGGYLARPSFPIHLRTRGPVGKVVLDGNDADRVELHHLGLAEWIARPAEPLDLDIVARVIPTMGEGDFSRRLRLRRAVLAPNFRDIPNRYASDEPPMPAGWSALSDRVEATGSSQDGDASCPIDPRLDDLMEYFAARTGILPLGGVLELLSDVTAGVTVDVWDLLRSLFEAGVLEPLRVRGWRGKAVVARPPVGSLVRIGPRFGLRVEGVLSEITRGRIVGAARAGGLETTVESGATPWAVGTLQVMATTIDQLTTLASNVGLPTRGLVPHLGDLTAISRIVPDGPGAANYKRARAPGDLELWRCDPERDDAQIVWMTPGRDGADRFWTTRGLAVLDACRQAGLRPFAIEGQALVARDVGARLPLAAARWLRLVTGMASGPDGVGAYRYGFNPAAAAAIRHVLGDLVGEGATRARVRGAPRPGRVSQGGIATRTNGAVRVQPVWRLARQRRL